MRDFAQGKNLKKEDSLMKNILWIILENFQPILGGLFFVFLCLLTGQFGWALIVGIMTFIAAVAIVLIYWKDYKRRNSRQNDFKKWTKGK